MRAGSRLAGQSHMKTGGAFGGAKPQENLTGGGRNFSKEKYEDTHTFVLFGKEGEGMK